jgi:hypothetical protein
MMASDRWAYQVIDLKPGFLGLKSASIQAELNRLGAQGWELVSMISGMPARLVLKRAEGQR